MKGLEPKAVWELCYLTFYSVDDTETGLVRRFLAQRTDPPTY